MEPSKSCPDPSIFNQEPRKRKHKLTVPFGETTSTTDHKQNIKTQSHSREPRTQHDRNLKQHSGSSDSESESDTRARHSKLAKSKKLKQKRSRKTKQPRKKHKRRHSNMQSSSSESSDTDTSAGEKCETVQKKVRKESKSKKHKKSKRKKKRKKLGHTNEKNCNFVETETFPHQSALNKIQQPIISEDCTEKKTKRVMAPMTKEEYEKQQSVVRRVFDPDTGRNRLVRGEGEIIEEVVSRQRHQEINRQATQGDGLSFQIGLHKYA